MTSFSATSPDQTLHELETTVKEIVLHTLGCVFQPITNYTSQIPSPGCLWWPLKMQPSGPYSVSAGLTPCLVCVPDPCCSLPLHLDLPSQGLGRLLGAVGAAGLFVPARGATVPGTLAVVLARGSNLLVSYKDRSWAWKQKSGLQAVQGSSRHSARQGAAQSHWLHYSLVFHPLLRGRAKGTENVSRLKVERNTLVFGYTVESPLLDQKKAHIKCDSILYPPSVLP